MLSAYINYMKARQMSENTIRNYVKYAKKMLDHVGKPESEITYMDLTNYQASISKMAANSIRLQIAGIRSYFDFLERNGVIKSNPAAMLDKPKANPKEKKYMSEEDVSKMVASARTLRDAAMIKFMASTGVRISELSNITLDDYNTAMGDNREILINGKGRKERRVYVNSGTEQAISAYLSTRKDDCPYLFASFQRTKLNPECTSQMLKTTARRAGLPYWQDVTNHAMRAAFATIANKKGVDVATISKAMGHSSIAITSIYIKNTQDSINNAMSQMDF